MYKSDILLISADPVFALVNDKTHTYSLNFHNAYLISNRLSLSNLTGYEHNLVAYYGIKKEYANRKFTSHFRFDYELMRHVDLYANINFDYKLDKDEPLTDFSHSRILKLNDENRQVFYFYCGLKYDLF